MSVQSLSLKIHSRYGEQTRKWLLSHDFLNLKLKITSKESDLFFPLNTSKKEFLPVFESFPFKEQAEIVEFHFERKKEKPRSLTEALMNIIPKQLHELIPKSFDQIGNIAIIEFEEELTPFKEEIGKQLCSLFPSIKTVYRKSSSVSGEYRLRGIEYLYGEKKTETIHKEYGIRIFVDVEKTYFSPRLGDEHHRVAKQVKENEIVVDMFTAAGPFPLHITKNTEATIYAVDINEQAIECLRKSITLNRLKGKIIPIAGDVRKIINDLPKADRIIMNLPKTAIEFVQDASKLFKKGTILHFYAFVNEETGEQDIYQLLSKELNKVKWKISQMINFQKIRESAPYEIHACIDVELAPLTI